MRKGILCGVAVLSMVSLLLTGCANNGMTAAEVNQISPVARDELLTTQKVTITAEEKYGLTYQHVTDNIQIDLEDLISPSESEETLIREHMKDIIEALKGKDNGAISDDMINYILWEMTRTQYSWLQDGDIQILGIDPATRKVFVDVNFKTDTSQMKTALQKSSIIKGDPMESLYKESRLNEYMKYLNEKYDSSSQRATYQAILDSAWTDEATKADAKIQLEKLDTRVEQLKANFENHWGKIEVCLDEQAELTLIDRLRQELKNQTIAYDYDEAFEQQYTKATSNKPTVSEPTPVVEDGETDESDGTGDEETSSNDVPVVAATPSASLAIPAGELSSADLKHIMSTQLGQYTYAGTSTQTAFGSEATMGFRFIFDFDYNLGAGASLSTTSVYLMHFAIIGYEPNVQTVYDAGASFENEDFEKRESIAVVTPYVDRLVRSYQKCIEECDMRGLYKLYGTRKPSDDYTDSAEITISRFENWDKLYNDWNRFCYTKFDGYDIQILDWVGDTITVRIDRSKKIRGRGTQMTQPTYDEVAVMVIEVVDNQLYIVSETVLETTLTGEPISMIRDVSGIGDKIAFEAKSFSMQNESGVYEALKNFTEYQLDYFRQTLQGASPSLRQSATEAGAIDMGVGAASLADISKTMGELAKGSMPTEKIVWLGTWADKSNMYVRVRIREFFIFENGEGIDTEAYVGLVRRNNYWVVVSYDRTVANRQSNLSGLNDKGCLYHEYANETPTISKYAGLTLDENGKYVSFIRDTSAAATESGTETTESGADEAPAETGITSADGESAAAETTTS